MIMQRVLAFTSGLSLAAAGFGQSASPVAEAAGEGAASDPRMTITDGSTAPAEGAGEGLGESRSAWRASFTAWIWVVGMEGTAGARGRKADVSASFGDILDASDSLFAFSGRLEVGSGSLGGFFDGMYSSLGVDDQTTPNGVGSVDVTNDIVLLDFGLSYRLGEWEPGGDAAANSRDISVDLYAGARYTHLELELDPANFDPVSKSVDWFDPIVGGKLMLPISERWHLAVNGDIGGFGAGSDFTWSATGVFGYDFHLGKMRTTASVGYRAIGQDYSEGSGSDEFTWDIIQHGLLFGLTLHF